MLQSSSARRVARFHPSPYLRPHALAALSVAALFERLCDPETSRLGSHRARSIQSRRRATARRHQLGAERLETGRRHGTRDSGRGTRTRRSRSTLSTSTAERHASGFSGCNRYMGSYALKDGKLARWAARAWRA